MLDIIFNGSNFETTDLSNFHYLRPKKIHNEGPSPAICRVYYEEDGRRMNVCFETEPFNLVNGIQRTPSGIHYIDFGFNGNETFLDFINLINELNINKTYENSKKWFNKQIELDLIDSYYKYPLRVDLKTRENFIRLRVDVENLNIQNQYGKMLSLENVCSNIKSKIKIRFDGIQILRQNFFPIFNISEITLYERKKFIDNHELLDEDNGLPNLLDTNVNYEDTETQTFSNVLRNSTLRSSSPSQNEEEIQSHQHNQNNENNQDATEQNQDTTEENQDATEQNEDATEENQDVTEQNQDATEENQDVTEQNQDAIEENQDVTEQNEDATEENQDVTEQSEGVTEQNEDVTEQNEEGQEVLEENNEVLENQEHEEILDQENVEAEEYQREDGNVNDEDENQEEDNLESESLVEENMEREDLN